MDESLEELIASLSPEEKRVVKIVLLLVQKEMIIQSIEGLK